MFLSNSIHSAEVTLRVQIINQSYKNFITMRKFSVYIFTLVCCCLATAMPVGAQLNLKNSGTRSPRLRRLSLLLMPRWRRTSRESVDWMDKNNPVLPEDNPYTVRLRKLTEGITDADGIPLNF